LLEAVQSLPASGYYGGFLGETSGIKFVGGAGILLSRDLVEYAARDKRWDWDLMDDVALARCLERAGVLPRELSRIDVVSLQQVRDIHPERWRNCFHVRCRSAGDRSREVETMHLVHAGYLKACGMAPGPDVKLS